MKAKRKQYSPGFKAKVALEALKDKDTLAELSKKYEVHPTQIGKLVELGYQVDDESVRLVLKKVSSSPGKKGSGVSGR
jgi:transposase-like protein